MCVDDVLAKAHFAQHDRQDASALYVRVLAIAHGVTEIAPIVSQRRNFHENLKRSIGRQVQPQLITEVMEYPISDGGRSKKSMPQQETVEPFFAVHFQVEPLAEHFGYP